MLAATACTTLPDRVALVVANEQYVHAEPLDNPVNDARAIATELASAGWEVSLAVDRPRADLVELVQGMTAQLDHADRVILYYAGHGMQIDGRNYLVPIDFDPRAEDVVLDEQLFSLDVVLESLKRDGNQLAVFLDACRDNPLAATFEENLRSRASRGISVSVKRPPRFDRGLAEVDTAAGTLIAFSTEPGSVALDGEGRHSPFARGLLRHIGTPNRDLGWVLKRVRADVIKLTDGEQVPWDHSSLTRDFEIRSHRPAAPPP